MQLPEDFCKQMEALLGSDAYCDFFEALADELPVSVRLNSQKLASDIMDVQKLVADGQMKPVPWCADGYYLHARPAYTFDPLFHAGAYYVQEASSMFLEQVIRKYVSSPIRALDLCAAPGGKSTLLRSVLPAGSVLVSNEVVRTRAQILVENITKWGHPDCVVTNNDPACFTHPFSEVFQLIVVDAPCSGEGMFRKDEGAINEWSAAQVDLCVERQQRILRDIWPCLQPGGILVYSTCTFNRFEDEDNLQWLIDNLGAEPLCLDVPSEWRIAGDLTGRDLPVWRFMPHYVHGEGFFLCAVRKPGEAQDMDFKQKKQKRQAKAVETPQVLSAWIQKAEEYSFQQDRNNWFAVAKSWEPFFAHLKANLHVLHAGVPLAEPKGKDLLPLHGLAMSTVCRAEAFPQVEVAYEVALAYLRKEAIVLPAEAPRGFVLLTYKTMPLGFVKNLGNRANNQYPAEWRVRSSYLPADLRLPWATE